MKKILGLVVMAGIALAAYGAGAKWTVTNKQMVDLLQTRQWTDIVKFIRGSKLNLTQAQVDAFEAKFFPEPTDAEKIELMNSELEIKILRRADISEIEAMQTAIKTKEEEAQAKVPIIEAPVETPVEVVK